MIAEDEKLLAALQARLDDQEATVAKSELDQLTNDVTEWASAKRIKPIRAIAAQVNPLTTQISENQTQFVRLAKTLKEQNQSAADLLRDPYILAVDKELLQSESKIN